MDLPAVRPVREFLGKFAWLESTMGKDDPCFFSILEGASGGPFSLRARPSAHANVVMESRWDRDSGRLLEDPWGLEPVCLSHILSSTRATAFSTL